MTRTSGPPSAYELRTSPEFADWTEEAEDEPPPVQQTAGKSLGITTPASTSRTDLEQAQASPTVCGEVKS